MSETCTVNIVNNSGRPLDGIAIWHTDSPPGATDITPEKAVIKATHVQNGQILAGTADLTRYYPRDDWTMGVLFQGDGTTYLMCGYTAAAWKEYEVSGDSLITFTIPPYSANTTNQPDIPIAYSGDDGGKAYFLNIEVVEAVEIAEDVADVLSKLIE